MECFVYFYTIIHILAPEFVSNFDGLFDRHLKVSMVWGIGQGCHL